MSELTSIPTSDVIDPHGEYLKKVTIGAISMDSCFFILKWATELLSMTYSTPNFPEILSNLTIFEAVSKIVFGYVSSTLSSSSAFSSS
jgi:hypothetical protein